MKGMEVLIVGGLTLLLLIALAITVPVELSNRSSSGTGRLQVTEGRALRYYVVGDYGELSKADNDTLQPVQVVAQQMSSLALQYPIDFIATTGDNVYPSGMKDVFDWRQFELMYGVFNADGLSGKPWYPVFGNHDCETPKPMLDAGEIYPMWNMPSAYYNMTLELDGDDTVAMIFLDGCTISCEQVGTQPLPSFCEDYGYTEEGIEQQYQWLAEVLKDARNAKWVLVHTHMPPFSAGSGNGDNEALKIHLLPMLQEAQVDILFTGHEHLMQYFYIPAGQPYIPAPSPPYLCSFNSSYLQFAPETLVTLQKGNGLQEVVIGSSGHPLDQLCPERVTNMAELVFGSTTFGFAQVEVASSALSVTYYSAEDNPAEALFKVVITP